MKIPLPSRSLFALGLAVLASTLSVLAFELNEGVLGIADPPYKIGHVLTDEQLSDIGCTESGTGLLVCPIRRYDDRLFSIMIDRSDSENRVTAVLVTWKCEPQQCDDKLRETVSHYSQVLGESPDELDGNPIWKDREVSRRDLIITRMSENMIALTLLKSDP